MDPVSLFIRVLQRCIMILAEHQKLGGLLQEIQVPTWKWEYIIMDFVVGFPRTKQYKSIWVVMDRLTESAYFIPATLLTRWRIMQGSS